MDTPLARWKIVAPALTGAFLAAFLLGLIPLYDSDSWWHLAVGRSIWESGIPTVNGFSSVFPDYPYGNAEWLFALAAYASVKAAGLPGASILQALLVALAFLLAAGTFLAGRRTPAWRDLGIALPLFLAAVTLCRFRFPLRPHLATWAGLALLLFLWTARERSLRGWRGPLAFGLAAALWSNLHPGVTMGTVLCGLFLASSALARDRDGVKTALLSGAGFLAGSLANPFGWYPYQYTFSSVTVESAVPFITEYAPASFARNPGFYLWAGVCLAALPLRLRSRDLLFPLLAGAFFAVGSFASREIPVFILLTLPGVLLAFAGMGDAIASRPGRWAGRVLPGVLVLALLAGAGFVARRELGRFPIFHRFGAGANPLVNPRGAATFVSQRGFTGVMYNDLLNAGYLMWALPPGQKVLWDGRLFAYPVSFLRELQGGKDGKGPLTLEELRRLAEKYRFEYAVVTRAFQYRRHPGDLFEAMGWKLVYLDGISCVFVRPGSENEARAGDHVFGLLRLRGEPGEAFAAGRGNPGQMRSELAMIDPAALFHPGDLLRFGLAAWGAGELETAERLFTQGARSFPRDPAWGKLLADLHRKGGLSH